MAKEIGYDGLSLGNSDLSDRLRNSRSDSDDVFYEVGQTLKEGITRLTVIADAREEQMLQRLDRDYKAIANSIKSAINDTTYFREGTKSIDPVSGLAVKDYYVQTSEVANAYEALRTTLGHFVGTNYETRAREMDYITGTRSFEGKQAQAKAMYEISRRGGKLLPSPSKDNPDLYTYMLPFSDTWAKGTALDDYLNFIFTDSDALSKLEHEKRLSDADRDRNYAKAKKMEMMNKLSIAQAKEAGGVWEEFENEQKKEEYRQLQANTARAKQMAMMDALSASQAKEAGGVWEEFERDEEAKRKTDIEVNYQANQRVKRENAQKDAQKAREEEKARREEEREKAKETLASTTKRMFILGQIASMFTVLLDLTRRILSNGLSMASDAKRTEREARNIGSSYGAMAQYAYADKAYGLPEGTTPGALFALQRMFGNTANIDTKALGKLAMIMGNDVGDMVRSGLGGKNPEKLLEMIMDAFLKAEQSGVNQFGQQVGKEEARRSLYTLLSEVSPEIATLFSRAIEANEYGINKGRAGTWQDYLNINKRALGGMSNEDMQAFSALGEVVDQLKAKFENFTSLISQTFLMNFSRLVDRINNLNWGKNSTEQLYDRQETIDAIANRRSQLLSANAVTTSNLETALSGLGAVGSLEEILFDISESPGVYGAMAYSQEEINRKLHNKQAVEMLYMKNPLARSLIASYLVRKNVIAEMEKQLMQDKPAYNALTWSDENIYASARTVNSMALEPMWNMTEGIDLTGGWSRALVTEGYGDGTSAYPDNVTALKNIFNGMPYTERQKFVNAYESYMSDIFKLDSSGNLINTKELALFRKALERELFTGMSSKQIKEWKKKNKKAIENYASVAQKQLAYIRLLTAVAEERGELKSSVAPDYFGEASEASLQYGDLSERDVTTIGSYFDRFIQEQGNKAVNNISWSVVPQGGGSFTLRFEADVNGNETEKEYKDITLSSRTKEVIRFEQGAIGTIITENAESSSN